MAPITSQERIQPVVDSPIPPKAKTPRYAWVILLVTYLLSLTAPFGQFKVTALSEDIIATYGMNYANFGLLMSALSIIGVVLAFPGAFICRRLGLRATLALSAACVALGGIIEVILSGPEFVALLYIGRLFEGVGIGLIGVAAPTLISLWFPDRTRGLALGLWCTWYPLAITIDLNVAPVISAAAGWQMVFWIISIYSLIALVLFLIFFRVPKGDVINYNVEGSFRDCFKYLKNKYIWILAAACVIFNFTQSGVINTYYPQFLQLPVEDGGWGMTAAEAGFMTSVITFIGLFATPLGGAITDRLRRPNRFILLAVAMALSTISWFVWAQLSVVCLWAFVIIMGFAAGAGGGGTRPLAPSIMCSSAMAATMGMATMQFSQCLGTMGSPIFGALLDSGLSYNTAGLVLLVPLTAIALVLSFFIRPGKDEKRDASEERDAS